MRQRFRARELWLLVPFLLIGAAAFYWGQQEKVEALKPQGMFVSDFRVEPAPGAQQEVGMSHRVTVTVSHSLPKPTWWGGPVTTFATIDALQADKPHPLSAGQTAAQYPALGNAITIVRDGKTKKLPPKYGTDFMDFRFDGTNYVSVNYVNGSDIMSREEAFHR